MARAAGNGHVERIVYRETKSGATVCTSTITIVLKAVEIYTDGSPSALFSFTHSGKCEPTDMIIAATVGWAGNPGTQIEPDQEGSDYTQTGPVERRVDLPEGITPSNLPIWIKITKYGNEGGSLLPYTMTFATR